MQGLDSSWRNRRVLVTGCTEFLGLEVTRELLHQQAHVIGLVHDRKAGAIFAREQAAGLFHLVQGRIENTFRVHSALAIHEVSAIFHLAESSLSSNSTGKNRAVDDRGTTAVLQAAALYSHRLPIVVASPSNQLRVLNSEVGGKQAPIGIARFGKLFGGRDNSESSIIARTISFLNEREREVAREDSSHDFVFIRDAARACLAVGEAIDSGSYPLDATFRTGWEMSEAEMAENVRDMIAGHALKAGFEEETPANPFSWRPEYSFVDALADAIECYRATARSRNESIRSTYPGRKAA